MVEQDDFDQVPSITRDQLDEWETLADSASGGPWFQKPGQSTVVTDNLEPEATVTAVCYSSAFAPPRIQAAANAKFIAAAREAVPRLVYEVLRHRAELQIARNDFEMMEHATKVREEAAYKAAWERARRASPFDTWQQAFREWKER